MLEGLTERDSFNMTRETNGAPDEQEVALKSVSALLAELKNASWRPYLYLDAIVKPEDQKQLLRRKVETMLKAYEAHVAIDQHVRIADHVMNSSSPAAGQMLGWVSTLHWLDEVAPPDADLLVMRIDLVLKPPFGLRKRPDCVVFPFQGHMFNATDAFVFIPAHERHSFMHELKTEAPLSENEIGLHCLLGRIPGAAPLLGADPYDANSANGRNPVYRIAGRQEPDEEEPTRVYASWMLA